MAKHHCYIGEDDFLSVDTGECDTGVIIEVTNSLRTISGSKEVKSSVLLKRDSLAKLIKELEYVLGKIDEFEKYGSLDVGE